MEIGIHKGVFKYTKLKPTKVCGKSSLLTLEFCDEDFWQRGNFG